VSAAARGTPTDSMAVAHSTLDTSVSPSMPTADSEGTTDFFGLQGTTKKNKLNVKTKKLDIHQIKKKNSSTWEACLWAVTDDSSGSEVL